VTFVRQQPSKIHSHKVVPLAVAVISALGFWLGSLLVIEPLATPTLLGHLGKHSSQLRAVQIAGEGGWREGGRRGPKPNLSTPWKFLRPSSTAAIRASVCQAHELRFGHNESRAHKKYKIAERK